VVLLQKSLPGKLGGDNIFRRHAGGAGITTARKGGQVLPGKKSFITGMELPKESDKGTGRSPDKKKEDTAEL